jgi:hypothetical protein
MRRCVEVGEGDQYVRRALFDGGPLRVSADVPMSCFESTQIAGEAHLRIVRFSGSAGRAQRNSLLLRHLP